MREAPHLRLLFSPMMLAHSALVTQLNFYDVQIRKLAKGDETTPTPNDRARRRTSYSSGIPQHDR
jgi:hypothetical protein